MDRLVYYDSLIEQTNKTIKNITLSKFDLPLQQKEQETYLLEILKKERALRILYILVFLAVLSGSFFYLRYIKLKKRFAVVMENKVVPITESSRVASKKFKDTGIDRETIETILANLSKWENELGYLDREIDQNVLAKALETNSTYLSKIINAYKKQNFSQYLNDLRATYAVNYIKQNPALVRSRSLIQLAEQFGFNSTDSFIRAFKSKVGITPSAFLIRLKKGNL